MRQRGAGRWEVRVSLGPHALSGQSVYRSITVHGDLAQAEHRRAVLAAQAEQLRRTPVTPVSTVGELLNRWLTAEHCWKPSTWRGYRETARRLRAGPLILRSPEALNPVVMRAVMRDWERHGVPTTTISLQLRTLRSAMTWAFQEGLMATQPLAGMHGPAQPDPKRDVPVEVVQQLLQAASADIDAAASDGSPGAAVRLHRAEQLMLLLRLAADTGARRGELSALRTGDLHGRVLHLDRGISDEVVTTTKTNRTRRVTLGTSTAALWQHTINIWQARLGDDRLGAWLFSADPDHRTRLRTASLGHWFAAFTRQHGQGAVTLHRLRHTVATALVDHGNLLRAQQRLGHRDASTTLRQYCHALPLEDLEVADYLEALYEAPVPAPRGDGESDSGARPR